MRRTVLAVVAGILLLGGCARPGDDPVVRNTEVIRECCESLWSRGKVELIKDLYAEDFIGHFPEGTVRGREGIKERVEAHRTAFPDWTETIDDTIAQGDRVAARFTSRGTNDGEFLGSPATGKRVEISEVAIFRLSDGQIIEQWVYPDMLSMQRQLAPSDSEAAE